MTDEKMRELSIAGMTLDERLACGTSETPDEIYRLWMKKSSGDDEAIFERRLALQGLTMEQAPFLFGAPSVSNVAPWVEEIQKIVSPLPTTRDEILPRLKYNPFKQEPHLPVFFSCFAPLLLRMEERLEGAFAASALEDAARVDVMAGGLRGICLLFDQFIIEALNDMSPAFLPMPFSALEEYCEPFSSDMLAGGLERAFVRYPSLGRATVGYIDAYVNYVKEFLTHFTRDMEEIREKFGAAGNIARLSLSCGDTHNGGRFVVIAEFSNGVRVVYKPDDAKLDVAFARFLEYLSEAGALDAMKTPQILSRESYSYKEFVPRAPLPDRDSARRFYRRAGQLLCLVGVIGGTDLHCENVVAYGEYPVPVDLETILRPAVQDFVENEKPASFDLATRESILGSLLLFTRFGDQAWEDAGGIAIAKSDRNNAPFFEDGREIDRADIEEGLIEGFERAWRGIAERKGEIAEKLSLFSDCRVRVLLRATQTYTNMLAHVLRPGYLEDGLTRSFEVERLFTAFSPCTDPEMLRKLFAVYRAEYHALLSGDIPIFYVGASDRRIGTAEGVLCDGYIGLSPIERAEGRISKMDAEGQMALQTRLIRRELAHRWLYDKKSPPHAYPFSLPLDEAPRLAPAQFLDEANAVFEEILNDAVTIDGVRTWLGRKVIDPGTPREYLETRPVDGSLYDGLSGLAVFAGALCLATGDRGALAEELFAGALDDFTTAGETPVGATHGAGALLMASAFLADCLGRPEIRRRAEHLAAVDAIDFEGVVGTDYMYGIAGYIVAADRFGAETEVLRRAADRLMALREECDGFGVWRNATADRPLIGLGHGQSGRALALKKAYDRTGDGKYLTAAEDALAFERRWYSPGRGWPDFRASDFCPEDGPEDGPDVGAMCGFCSGAPGLGAARLDMLGLSEDRDAPLLLDIENAVQNTKSFATSPRDTLCCGNMSRVDFLLSAGWEMNRKDWVEEAEKRLCWVVARKRHYGHYILDTRVRIMDVGLFSGLAGIGYELLRAARGARGGLPRIF
ncbi:MAG: type 2 lantipeptide synthetase LanM [Synergistaceae bacterium]|jgi:lantibiotic modifying enzyme|nr:type 2 lantipeptide synthetase LanM [Synergistaceae bacterium]